jgi:hypothetical protein
MTDLVRIDITFDDGTGDTTEPMTRWLADLVCLGFANAVPWDDKRVTRALLVPWSPMQ